MHFGVARPPRLRIGSLLLALALLAACSGGPQAAATPTPLPGREHAPHETLPPDATPFPDRLGGEIAAIGRLPKDDHSADFFNSDLAFWGDMAVQGSYDGFRLIDITDPERPQLLADVACRGPQGDVSIWQDLVLVSVDRPQSSPGCDSEDADKVDPLFLPDEGPWEGIRIFDVSRPSAPRLVTSVATDCGSHTHTLLPDLEHDRLLVYVSSYALQVDPALAPDCLNPHGHISVLEVPLDAPEEARVIARPHLFDTPAWQVWPGAGPGLEDTAGCHDITLDMARALAAGACMSEGQIWDLADPERPAAVAHLDLPDVSFWHSAAWSNDGSVVIFGDENLAEAGCTDAPLGSLWFYRVDDPARPQLAGRFSLDRYQGSDICSAHMFNVIPGIDRDLLVSAFYSGGTSVIDFTDPSNPVEIAYFDAGGRAPGDDWSSYWYRGHIYASDHLRGLDVFRLSLPDLGDTTMLDHLNPQTQE
jgi:hypothetical protein